tara:strand:- start:413 stop:907 length:495 start_codon:yes stop_codon:yes gene_type:complete
MKTSITFDFFKLSRFVQSKEYKSLKSRSFGEPTAKAIQKFIKAGNITPQIARETRKTRKHRKRNPSIGGNKPLYDTGALANGIMYDKGKNAIVGLARNRYGKHYSHYHLTDGRTPSGKPIPKRNFIEQTQEIMNQDISKSFFENKASKKLFKDIKRNFSRRLAR